MIVVDVPYLTETRLPCKILDNPIIHNSEVFRPMRVVFLHPDLGIGGAERLVCDAALALKSKGHHVSFLTTYHNPDHCFPETRDGTFPVSVVANWFPRSIFGQCRALCMYIRMIIGRI